MFAVTRRRAAPKQSVLRQELEYFLQVVGISAFAVTQPVLDLMGKSPETFIFRGAGRGDIALFGLMVALLPALTVSAIAFGTRVFGPRIRRGVHLGILGAMTSLIVIQGVKLTTPLRDGALVALALVSGIALIWLVARVRAVGMWMRWAAA
jgi:hypothetical protein